MLYSHFRHMLMRGIAAAALILCSAPTVMAAPPFELPAHARQIAAGVYDLGSVRHHGQLVQGYAFLHPSQHAARPDNPGGGRGGNNNGGSDCYAYIGNGAAWQQVEDYLIDSQNLAGMNDVFVAAAIDTSTAAWNAQAGRTIFGVRVAGVVDGAETTQPDDKNEVYFAAVNEAGVIAVTTVWGVFSGPPRFRRLVEWDQVYDDVDFAWGDADTNTGVMDMLNIAIHEVGHAAGMDHPADTCTEESMYAYAATGETKKRDLHDGDIAGIGKLY